MVREQATDRLGLLAELPVRDLDLSQSMSATDLSSRNVSRDHVFNCERSTPASWATR